MEWSDIFFMVLLAATMFLTAGWLLANPDGHFETMTSLVFWVAVVLLTLWIYSAVA